MLDLDADPVAVDDLLRRDPVLAPYVDKSPGRRVPRTADGAEFAGDPVTDAEGGLTHLFPASEALAEVDPATLAFPQARRVTLTTLAAALAAGEIDLGPGSDWAQARVRLGELPGLGPWTIETIAMRALGDPDAFTATDLGVRIAARHLGLPGTPAALIRHSAAWRPWRAYAVQHLWATGDHAINRIPA
jgi:AraC family transcriptional regulator of adaptative response / DNA-3-methyladenine glycosylase II